MKASGAKYREYSPEQTPMGHERTQAQTYLDQSASGINSSMAPHDFQVDESQDQLKLQGAVKSEAPTTYKSEYGQDKARIRQIQSQKKAREKKQGQSPSKLGSFTKGSPSPQTSPRRAQQVATVQGEDSI